MTVSHAQCLLSVLHPSSVCCVAVHMGDAPVRVVRAWAGLDLASARFGYYLYSAMSIAVTPKRRGRPATGKDPVVTVRLPEKLVALLNECAEAEKTPLSEIIRVAVAKHLRTMGYRLER